MRATYSVTFRNSTIPAEVVFVIVNYVYIYIYIYIYIYRSSIFHMFDQLMLLSGGKIIYFGAAKDSITYFARIGTWVRHTA